QNQIEEHGNHIFKDGAVVVPGNVSFNNQYQSVRLNSTFGGESIDPAQYYNSTDLVTVTGETSGVTAEVIGYSQAEEDAAEFIKKIGVQHLLIDLPSIDKEKDDGKLLAHKAFWDLDGKIRKNATITEFIYVKNKIEDGKYILNLQIASFENDATPSKPILYKIE
ncbi:hypothetical protein, partial [uncultured Alcanivorax sp.]|uniref:hypothetical protein n=1 Tax=uncultured Alcanivorax sp. TaxID=191215 RepID=UPI0026277B52